MGHCHGGGISPTGHTSDLQDPSDDTKGNRVCRSISDQKGPLKSGHTTVPHEQKSMQANVVGSLSLASPDHIP